VLRAFALESPTIWETCIWREREIRFPDILENAVQRNCCAVHWKSAGFFRQQQWRENGRDHF
jgi:hypothetical protein